MASEYEYYRYDPSVVAAIVFVIAFLLSTSLHSYQMMSTKTWCLAPLIIGGFFEWIGFGARTYSCTQSPNWSLGPFVAQAILLLVAPALFAASIYMELGRIIQLTHGEKHSMIRQRWLTKIFVTGDILSFLMQSAGASMQTSKTSEDAPKLGKRTILSGLGLQIVFFSFFIVVTIVFDRRIRKRSSDETIPTDIPWRQHLWALYTASALILVRSVFRVVEYIQGDSGYIISHEVFLYVFDAMLMLCVIVLFNVIHPSEIKAGLKGGKFARGILLRTL